ncbi:hypothetical protein PVX_089780 [Plasmodium vivax]|uniref:Secreted protein n=1 Tax=Plasmodium vivax (strain Salvador I) TaxID=126793 RepID=A5K5Y4_PLAVS|nr:hypothetical protein PVX_089780 [Plasmodium vivax]EDL45319.1 hypothetical protein PVX_089780 [Plasmodium vivax]|eukprot:XP_001615046.1 hypothetical protein [Plasmodium vivax Sal-1]
MYFFFFSFLFFLFFFFSFLMPPRGACPHQYQNVQQGEQREHDSGDIQHSVCSHLGRPKWSGGKQTKQMKRGRGKRGKRSKRSVYHAANQTEADFQQINGYPNEFKKI